ncbi:Diapolycopene oxygenase, partial [Orchesella cincta]
MFTSKKMHKGLGSLIVQLLKRRDLQTFSTFSTSQSFCLRERPTCAVIRKRFQERRIPYDIFASVNNHHKAHTYVGSILELVPKEIQKRNCEVIANLLGINVEDVSRIPKKEISEEKAQRVYRVLQEFGLSSGSVCLYPELLLMNHGAVENYLRIMQECCFKDIREVFIIRFRTVFKQSIKVLQNKSLLPKVEVIIDRHCAALGETTEFFKYLMDSLPSDEERISLFDLRSHILSAYFSKISLGTHDENQNTFLKYPRLYYKSVNWMTRTHKILTEKLGFSNEKQIRKHLYLMHADPNNLERVTQIQTLGGMDMKTLCQTRPKILMSSFEALKEIEESFIEHGIPFEAVQKYPEVFTLSSATIKQRLEEIDTTPEFQMFKSHPRVARLLYYQNKAKSRLEDFRTMQVRVPSLHLLSSDTKSFNKSLSSGDLRIRGVDILTFLSDVFQVDRKLIRESLIRHPHWLHIPSNNIQTVLAYIQKLHSFSKEQLIDAIPLFLYPVENVEKEVENVLRLGEAKLTDKYFLHMVLYFLERQCHFTGDAVWHARDARHDYEEDDVEVDAE